MTKTEFNKAKKYLKNKLPHHRFKLRENGKPIHNSRQCSETYVSISVDNLFDIVNELLNNSQK